MDRGKPGVISGGRGKSGRYSGPSTVAAVFAWWQEGELGALFGLSKGVGGNWGVIRPKTGGNRGVIGRIKSRNLLSLKSLSKPTGDLSPSLSLYPQNTEKVAPSGREKKNDKQIGRAASLGESALTG